MSYYGLFNDIIDIFILARIGEHSRGNECFSRDR